MRRHEAELPGFPTIQGIISSKSASKASSTKPNEREKEKEEEDKEEKDEAFRFSCLTTLVPSGDSNDPRASANSISKSRYVSDSADGSEEARGREYDGMIVGMPADDEPPPPPPPPDNVDEEEDADVVIGVVIPRPGPLKPNLDMLFF